jgi:hypothetical protein
MLSSICGQSGGQHCVSLVPMLVELGFFDTLFIDYLNDLGENIHDKKSEKEKKWLLQEKN